MKQDQHQKHKQKPDDAVQDEVVAEKHDFTDDVDSILDEIDEVLEEEAELFVKNYVQKGGQ